MILPIIFKPIGNQKNATELNLKYFFFNATNSSNGFIIKSAMQEIVKSASLIDLKRYWKIEILIEIINKFPMSIGQYNSTRYVFILDFSEI